MELTDVIFTLMHPDFPEVIWNISRIERDAFRGRFGEPEEILFSELADHPENDKWKHLDKAKVLRFMDLANVPTTRPNWRNSGAGSLPMKLIDIPTIAVALLRGPATAYMFPVDGNHRMMAREQLGYKSYRRFLVPPDLEGEYQVQMQELL